HIRYLLGETLFSTWMLNTLLISIAATLISLVCGLFAGYALSRLKFPLADIIRNFRLGDTPWALILTYPTFLIPFCTWLLMGYFRTIPYELEECALIDGATRWQILVKIVLPLAVPGLISAGIFAFTLSWNEFIYALTFISSSEVKTVPVGVVTELVEGDVYHWGALMAGALMGSLPVAILYSFFVEYYVSGMTGAVKE
ncbi:MAG: carbohydrate ABC transporter permease, partial [Usitatibacter sp.]